MDAFNSPIEPESETPAPSQVQNDRSEDTRISPAIDDAPEPDSVYKFLVYGLSLPERAIRSTAAVVSGATAGSATALLPRAFQDSKTYQTFVQQMLDLLANDVGGVKLNHETEGEEANPAAPDGEVGTYVAKKTVGSFVDLAGMATLHLSPMTILAIISDVAYGSRYYLQELAAELEREGIIDKDSTINSTADLLDAIGHASSESTDTFDQPPINLDELRETLQKTTTNLSNIDPRKLMPQSELNKMWSDMNQMADREQVSLFELSSAMTMYSVDQVTNVGRGTLSTVRVTGALLDQHLFDHYRQGLNEIGQRGIYTIVAEHSQPYLDAVWFNFAADRPTLTEDIVSGKLLGKMVQGISGWWAGDKGKPEQ